MTTTSPGQRALRATDQLLRPLVVVFLAALLVVQLREAPPAHFTGLVWVTSAVTVVAACAAAVPWRGGPEWARVALVAVYALAGAMVFALAPRTVGAAFVFIACATAGDKLSSRRAALLVAVASTVAAAAATWTLEFWFQVPDGPPWWLALMVSLPLYIGMARRERVNARAASLLAAEQTRRAIASETREAALEERSRIAREIHDVLGHSLSGVAVQLDMADALHVGGRSDEANEAVRRARALAVTGLGETKRAVHALREGALPLADTLTRLAQDGAAELAVRGDAEDVPVEIGQAVIRTAQEALTNARRHAPGSRVELLLECTADSVRFTATDGGATGQAPDGDQGSGMGLVGMRERAELLGGTLRAGPRTPPETGWTVRMELPR
ncbi:sensor histidine kinase [Saccharopolyspora gregorii]|uniref:sensor histidine kinase n=1 Tax=Saccharopolyspora gregorii TaxID=33914 RepID=UPI0021AC1535|nr:sensor histidine kinase [Saccharopolyspora gregorii]